MGIVGADVHQQITEMIPTEGLVLRLAAGLAFHLMMTNAPEYIVPPITFFEIRVSGLHELLSENRIFKLMEEQVTHNRYFDLIPVIAKLDVLSDFLSLCGGKVWIEVEGKNRALGHGACLGGLVGMFRGGVGYALK